MVFLPPAAGTGLIRPRIAPGTRIRFVLPAVTSVAGGAMLIVLRGVERLYFRNGMSIGPWGRVGREGGGCWHCWPLSAAGSSIATLASQCLRAFSCRVDIQGRVIFGLFVILI